MKKITLLLIALITAAAGWADGLYSLEKGNLPVTVPESSKQYLIEVNTQQGGATFLYGAPLQVIDKLPTTTSPETYVWKIVLNGDKYTFQNVGSGKYLEIAGTSDGGAINMIDDPSDIILEIGANDYCGLCNESGQYLDAGWAKDGSGICTWSEGVSGSRRLRIYEAIITPVTDDEVAKENLIATVTKYADYYSKFPAGTNPGQYGEEEVAAFQAALNNATEVLSEPSSTAEDFGAAAKAIEDSYNAVLESRVPLGIIPDGYYFIEAGMRFDGGTKGIYDNAGTASWMTIKKDSLPFVWELKYDSETTNYKLKNMAFDRYVSSTSGDVKLSEQTTAEESEVIITLVGWDDELKTPVVDIKREGTSCFHVNGHWSGTGVSNTVIFYGAGGATHERVWDPCTWYVEAVDPESVASMIEAFEPIKNRDIMLANVADMIRNGNEAIDIAKDKINILTSVDQMTFHVTEPYEGSEAEILDNNPNTFWHSIWSGDQEGNVYITVEVAEPVQVFKWEILRRKNNSDHVSKMNLYGSDNGTDFTLALADQVIGNATNGAAFSATYDLGQAYKYIKFEFTEAANSSSGHDYCYAHFAEFHMYAEKTGLNQYTVLGELATNLEAAIAAVPSSTNDITVEHYNNLKAAYDAFMAKFVDPQPLRNAIIAAENIANNCEIGTDPGYWEGDATSDLKAAIQDAKAYDESSTYTKEQSESFAASLSAAAEGLADKAIKVDTEKWYTIQFKTAESTLSLNPAETQDDENVFVEYLDECEQSQFNAFMADDNINNYELAAYRFVNVGDTAVAIQHYSGFFLNKDGKSLSVVPTLFTVKANGKGQNLINIVGTTQYLSINTGNDKLAESADTKINGVTGLYIHDVTDECSNDPLVNANIRINPNGMRIWCYPVSYSVSDGGLYEVAGKKIDVENDKVTLCFNSVEKAEAGYAYLYVTGNIEDEEDEDEDKEHVIFLNLDASEMVAEPIAKNGMCGQFAYNTNGDKEVVVVARQHYATNFGYKLATVESTFGDESPNKIDDRAADENYNEARDGFAWNGRINLDEVPEAAEGSYDLEVEVVGASATGIANIVDQITDKNGAIYTMDGKYVGKGNINSLKNMARGMYIVNGVKVTTK